ncbi:DUF1491 family protein [Sphingomonas sp. HF-S3]|uniref:DUF1491 family protein n=1 Tax=Sphingomonas rustica TaxID=3103142 RepID=A0ABV0BCX2_9SPHN
MARLTSAILVNALVRQAGRRGGSAMVLAHGDDTAGAILFVTLEKGRNPKLYEIGTGPDGTPALLPAGPRDLTDEREATAYWQRRRERDFDLWVLELDIAAAERFIAETISLH